MRDVWLRLRALLFRQRVEQELDDELSFHLELEARKNRAAGMAPAEAARLARLQFGTNPGAVKDYVRDAHGVGLIETLFRDIRYALRGFRRTPLFALTVIGTIAIGLGWNTAAFTIFNAYLLRPIDARDPYALYGFGWSDRSGNAAPLTWSQIDNLRQEHPGFSEVTAMFYARTRMDGRFVVCQLVDGAFFRMLGINATLGRTLLDESDTQSANDVVLSFTVWQNRFAGDPNVIGRKVMIQGRPFAVAGVMPDGFTGLGHGYPDVWIPLANLAAFEVPNAGDASMAGRLTPGERKGQAETALTAWRLRLDPQKAPRATLTSLATVVPLNRRMIAPFVAVGVVFLLVLLSACANVANLMLARAMSRQREIGIRLSLGAGRGRLIRQLLTESIALAIPAAALAFAVSQAFIEFGMRLILATMPPSFLDQADFPPIEPDVHVFWFMIGAAIAVALLFGLVPAIQATRLNVMQASRGDFSSEFRPVRLRNALVIAQVTVCGFLLICSGVLLRRANHLERLNPRMRTRDVLELYLQPKSRAKGIGVLRADSHVASLAASSDPPFDTVLPKAFVAGSNEGKSILIPYRYASPDYFQVLDIPMKRGRSFSPGEGDSETGVAIVSESAARKLWPDNDALGQSLKIAAATEPVRGGRPPRYRTMQVAGVVRDSAVGDLDNNDRSSLFFPASVNDPRNVLVLRAHGDPNRAVSELNQALEQADPGAVQGIHILQDYVDVEVWSYRLEFWISGALAIIALLLTVSGIYAVLSYVVAQRTKEIGIRVAIGATTGSVTRLVLDQCLRLAGIGIAAGSVLALAVARLLTSISADLGSQVFDGFAYGGGITVVLAACMAAAFFPARRAARVDPITTLRYD